MSDERDEHHGPAPAAYAPFAGRRSAPAYYRPARRHPRVHPDMDVSDWLYAYRVDDHDLGEIVAKIARLGRKAGATRVQELVKIAEHAVRALEHAELEVAERARQEAERGTRVVVDDRKLWHSLSQQGR